jgi:exodeoxyribonuclease V alpha subunit
VSAAELLALLGTWVERRWLREIDLALARFLWHEAPAADPLILLTAGLASHQLGRGHVCLDLSATLADPYMALSLPPESGVPTVEPIPLPADILAGITLGDWLARLSDLELVGDGSGRAPLVLAGRRFYLRRYWAYERAVERAITNRLALTGAIAADLPADRLPELLAALFPTPGDAADPRRTDWQKIACALAARSAFGIITGGPGTGKTTTVVRLLALLQSLALGDRGSGRPLRIRLAAPTGKAAARLRESIAAAAGTLPAALLATASLRDAIPTEVATLHRLLGTVPGSRRFRHDARTPLPLDILVIDEASMIDLEMMASVLAALPATARLILLGDRDQLASVEAGSVLGELCRRAGAGRYTPQTIDWLQRTCGETIEANLCDPAGQPLDQSIAVLRESHRFGAGSGIGRLADAVNAGNRAKIESVWAEGHADLARITVAGIDDPALDALLAGAPGTGFTAYLVELEAQRPPANASKDDYDDWARRVLEVRGRFQILCGLRNGPCGVSGLNRRAEALLARFGLIDAASPWYEGRPVLVTRNDYRLGVMNGDIGVVLRCPAFGGPAGESGSTLRVAFPRDDGSGGIHWVLPSRLPAVETVFAMTVHKAQGSEFAHCVLVLPAQRNPVLTRELAYTAITRARARFTLVSAGNPAVLAEAAGRRVQRSGGLFAGTDGENPDTPPALPS